MKPVEIACRHVDYDLQGEEINCEAKAGDPCFWVNGVRQWETKPGEFHAERIEDAAAMGDIE